MNFCVQIAKEVKSHIFWIVEVRSAHILNVILEVSVLCLKKFQNAKIIIKELYFNIIFFIIRLYSIKKVNRIVA